LGISGRSKVGVWDVRVIPLYRNGKKRGGLYIPGKKVKLGIFEGVHFCMEWGLKHMGG